MSTNIGIWIAALLTLAIYSFLYKDNPFYRFAECLLIGISVGFLLVVTVDTTLMPKAVNPLATSFMALFHGGPFLNFFLVLIPVILGLMMFARFVPGLAWLSRIAIALYIGFGAGAAIPANMQSLILKQVEATIRPFLAFGTIGNLINLVIIALGLIATLAYFFFSKPHTGNLGLVAKLGTYFLMIFFGATFGYTVMARISLLIGRITFLLRDWLGLIS
ncbi:MAG TPA: hypothetical protein DCZ43_04980 [candidate division Zixibacteria bacterium]|nr:hypothetical protein [candidate division Zixibacteria bacterium]